MSSNFDNIIKERLADAHIEPSADLWARIESSVAPVAIVPLWRRSVAWGSAVAALIAVAVALNVWFSEKGAQEQKIEIEEMIAQAEEPIILENKIEPQPLVAMATPKARSIANTSQEVAVAEVTSTPVKNSATPKREEPQQRAVKSTNNYTQIATRSAGEPTSEEKIATKSDRGVNLSLLYAEGPTTGSAVTTAMPRSYALCNSASGIEPLINPDTYMGSHITHRQPLSFAVNVSLPLADRVSIESGLNYTLLRSDVDIAYTANIVDQKISYLGLPLRLNYTAFEFGNFSLYASAGGMVERLLKASVGGVKFDERKYQFSVGGAIGIEYSINRWIGLYAEPDLSYYLTETKLMSIRNEKPLQFSARAGLRFRL